MQSSGVELMGGQGGAVDSEVHRERKCLKGRCVNSGGRLDESQAQRNEGLREDGTQNSR